MPQFNFKDKAAVLDAIIKEGVTFFENNITRAKFKKFLNDADFMFRAVKVDQEIMQYAPLETAQEMLKKDGSLLEVSTKEVRSNYQAIFNAASSKGESIEHAILTGLTDNQIEDIYYEAVSQNWRMIEKIDKKYAKKPEFIELALSKDSEAAKLVDKDIDQKDEKMAFLMAEKSNKSLKKYDRELRKNYKFAEKLITKNPENIEHVLGDLSDEVNLAKLALSVSTKANYKKIYKILPRKMQTNAEVAISYLEKEVSLKGLKGDVVYTDEVAIAAVRINGNNLAFYKGTHIVDNKEIVTEAVRNAPHTLKFATKAVKNDEAVVLVAVESVKDLNDEKSLKNHPLNFANKRFRDNTNLMLHSVEKCGLSLKFASKEIKNSKTIVEAAIRSNALAFEYARKAMKNDIDIVILAITKEPKVMEFVDKTIFNNVTNFNHLLKALKDNSEIYNNLPANLQKHKNVILHVAKETPEAVDSLSQKDRRDRAYMKEIAKVSKEAFEKAVSLKLLENKSYMDEIKAIWADQEKAKKQNKKEKTTEKGKTTEDTSEKDSKKDPKKEETTTKQAGKAKPAEKKDNKKEDIKRQEIINIEDVLIPTFEKTLADKKERLIKLREEQLKKYEEEKAKILSKDEKTLTEFERNFIQMAKKHEEEIKGNEAEYEKQQIQKMFDDSFDIKTLEGLIEDAKRQVTELKAEIQPKKEVVEEDAKRQVTELKAEIQPKKEVVEEDADDVKEV